MASQVAAHLKKREREGTLIGKLEKLGLFSGGKRRQSLKKLKRSAIKWMAIHCSACSQETGQESMGLSCNKGN